MATTDRHKMLQSALVLQLEAMKSLTREYYQQTEAFVTLTGEHPLTREPLRAAHSDGITLRTPTASAALGSASLISDSIARLTKDTCDDQACVRGPAQLTEFLKRVPETIKTDDDRVQVLFLLDRTLQHARKSRSSSDPATATAGRALISLFDQSTGYTMLMDWVLELSTYSDDARRRLTELLLQVLLRNKPKLPGPRKLVLTKLRHNHASVSGRANKALVAQVIEKYREGS